MSNNASLTPPAGDSRSSSPGAGEAKPRAVSGSLKDRIAKFNNPSAAPLVPTHAFGTAGPTLPSSAAGRGLIGNRIPSLDPKTAGMVGGASGQRKVSDSKGMIGNRMPSQPPAFKTAAGSTGARSNSPAGSIDSSSASGKPGSSASPNTSRSSSPPTSPGGGVPPSLLAATLPETGGPGAMTPSSTRAEAGEEATELSPPSTPNANPELPPQDDNFVRSDLTPNNLPANAVSANPAFRNLQAGGADQHHAPSITSSMASQYDSKEGSEDQNKMLQDVSGISTPMGTPRAANRDLEGSTAGSARGEGSVADVDELGNRLEGMDVQDREAKDTGSAPSEEQMEVDDNKKDETKDVEEADRDPTPEPPINEDDKPVDDRSDTFRDDKGNLVQKKGDNEYVTGDMDADARALEEEKGHGRAEPVPEKPLGEGGLTHDPKGALTDPDAKVEYTTNNDDQPDEDKPHVESTSDERDPNLDDDLDALKRGELHRPDKGDEPGTHTVDQNPVNNLVEASMGQNVAEHRLEIDETKHQAGVAGQRMEDVENADEVVQPDEARPPPTKDNDGGPDIREATPVATTEDEHLGPKGSLDGPQKFEVEWLEMGRGQSKAVDLDKQEYHWAKNAPTGEHQDQSGESGHDEHQPGTSEEGEQQQGKEEDSKSKAAQSTTGPAEDALQSQEGDKAAVLPDAPSTEPKTDSSKPLQIHIEPGPIAQPDNDSSATEPTDVTSVPDTSDEPTPSVEINPPTFPAPPSDDPDVVDPISHPQSRTSTPIDPEITRAFPEVPDEERPRVQVHVSSPVNTPSASRIREDPLDGSTGGNQSTPLASLPGKSKSLSQPDLARSSSGELDEGDYAGTPDEGGGNGNARRRLSARKSPKSPLLDDEDPGDFEPGEGWAVVTKGRDE